MNPDAHDDLDQLIDRGLAGYAAHEPLAGLEDRVLNRVRLANTGRRRRVWAYSALVLPAVATLVVVGVMSWTRRPPAPKPSPIATARIDRRPAPGLPTVAPVVRLAVPRRARRIHTRTLPKRDLFPTPTPLTPDERALITLARLRPAAVETLSELQNRSGEIRIAPIEIPPLDINGN